MMISILVTVIVAFFTVESIGFVVHRLAHWPKSGKLFRDHLHHHAHAYPPNRYQSLSYVGDLGKSFLPVFVPIFLGVNLLALVVVPWHIFLPFFAASATFSLANNYMHDSFHLTKHWLRRFGWYDRMTRLHLVHHQNVKKNLGIYWFGLDRIFGSFRKPTN